MGKPLLGVLLMSLFCTAGATATCKGNIERDIVKLAHNSFAEDPAFNNVDIRADALNLTLTGETKDDASRRRAQDLVEDIAFNVGIENVDNQIVISAPKEIPPRHYDVNVQWQPLSVTGEVPNEETKKTVLEVIKAANPSREIQDQLKIVDGKPYPNLNDALIGMVAPLPSLDNGRSELRDGKITIRGEAKTRALFNALPANFKATEGYPHSFELTVAEAFVKLELCQDDLKSAMADKEIKFATGSARINRASYGLLNQLAELLANCEDAAVEVAGHTDARGKDTSNQKLSERRAEAVVKYLNKKGVSERISFAGYGETRPVGDNETKEGRQQNRRIEFNVKGVN